MTSKRTVRLCGRTALFACALLLVAAVAAADEAGTQTAIAIDDTAVTCTCYWDRDCGTGGDCTGYGKCTKSGKLDGTCKTVATEEPLPHGGAATSVAALRLALPVPPADASAVRDAVELYVRAYAVPVDAGTGRPDATLLAAAQRIDLGARHAERHLRIQEAVHEALDATLGFDFILPEIYGDLYGGAVYGVDARLFGNVRFVPHGADEVVAAVRDALSAALADGDPAAVGAPLAAFWQANPDYAPLHTGRYYPHGHHGESHDVAGQQIEALTRIAERLIDLP